MLSTELSTETVEGLLAQACFFGCQLLMLSNLDAPWFFYRNGWQSSAQQALPAFAERQLTLADGPERFLHGVVEGLCLCVLAVLMPSQSTELSTVFVHNRVS